MNEFFQRLKQRKLVQWAIAYVAAAFALLQGIDIVAQQFGWAEGVRRGITLALVVGFFITLVLAWYHGERGAQRVSGTELLIIGLVLALGGGLLWRFAGHSLPVAATQPNEQSKALSAIPDKSIAVLPFENLSAEQENAYFANGMQDEILTRLSKIGDLKVISRTSTQEFQSKPGNLPEIARQLGVAAILEGSVQKAGEAVRVNVQLIKADGDSHLWAETYDRQLTDIFAVESEVAQKIATALEATLTGREKVAIASEGTRNPQAYDALLHAVALRGKQAPSEGKERLNYLRRAVELDPAYAQAWSYLAMDEAELYFFPDRSEAQKERARTAADTALRLAPDLPQAQAAMGVYHYYCEQDYDAAITQLQRAHAGAPNDATILAFIGVVRRRQGQLEECLSALRQAAILDPLNVDVWLNLGRTLRGMRRFAEARTAYDRAQAVAPNDNDIVCQKAEIDLAKGDLATAWSVVDKPKMSPLDPCFGLYMTLVYYRRDSVAIAAQTSELIELEKSLPPIMRSMTHVTLALGAFQRGDRIAALAAAAAARQDRDEMRGSGGISPSLYHYYIQMEARLGNRAEVEREIKELFDATRKDQWAFPDAEADAAAGYTLLGDFDHGLPLLEDALQKPSDLVLTPAILRLDPAWDSVRNDPRFQALLTKYEVKENPARK